MNHKFHLSCNSTAYDLPESDQRLRPPFLLVKVCHNLKPRGHSRKKDIVTGICLCPGQNHSVALPDGNPVPCSVSRNSKVERYTNLWDTVPMSIHQPQVPPCQCAMLCIYHRLIILPSGFFPNEHFEARLSCQDSDSNSPGL